jgi:mRNA interferase YafQ
MRYVVKPTGRFVRDYKLAKKRGMKMSLLEDVVAKLANGKALEKSIVTMS